MHVCENQLLSYILILIFIIWNNYIGVASDSMKIRRQV